MTLSTAMIIVFMVYVIPKIQKMYKDAKVNLPDLTQAVITMSEFLQRNIFILLVCIIAFIIAVILFKGHPKTKIYFDRFTLHVPIF
jgi:type IV pilus assembly protein PilC